MKPHKPSNYCVDPKDLESVNCNLCGGNSLSELYDFAPFKIVRCDHCELIFVNPRLKEEAVLNLYRNSYFQNPDFFSRDGRKIYGYDDYQKNRPDVERMYEKILSEIEILRKSGSLLEIGSAYGFFLNIAKSKGWDVSGIEMSGEAAEYSRSNFGIMPFVGSLKQYLSSSGKKFDVVVFFDVLEHLHDPTQALQSISSLLKPGGTIVFAVPNSGKWVFKLLGEKWEDLQRAKSNEHLFFFHEKTIEKILRICGFETVRIKTMGRWFNLKHLCDRMTIYNSFFFSLLGGAIELLRMSHLKVYINPGLKLIVYAKRINP